MKFKFIIWSIIFSKMFFYSLQWILDFFLMDSRRFFFFFNGFKGLCLAKTISNPFTLFVLCQLVINEPRCLWMLKLNLGKCLFMFICLVNKSNSSSSLSSAIKQTKLKHNNVFMNKLMNERLDLINYV